MDDICVCCGEGTVGGALHGVCSVAAGAAGVGVVSCNSSWQSHCLGGRS